MRLVSILVFSFLTGFSQFGISKSLNQEDKAGLLATETKKIAITLKESLEIANDELDACSLSQVDVFSKVTTLRQLTTTYNSDKKLGELAESVGAPAIDLYQLRNALEKIWSCSQ